MAGLNSQWPCKSPCKQGIVLELTTHTGSPRHGGESVLFARAARPAAPLRRRGGPVRGRRRGEELGDDREVLGRPHARRLHERLHAVFSIHVEERSRDARGALGAREVPEAWVSTEYPRGSRGVAATHLRMSARREYSSDKTTPFQGRNF